jgi:hypothetical protein
LMGSDDVRLRQVAPPSRILFTGARRYWSGGVNASHIESHELDASHSTKIAAGRPGAKDGDRLSA